MALSTRYQETHLSEMYLEPIIATGRTVPFTSYQVETTTDEVSEAELPQLLNRMAFNLSTSSLILLCGRHDPCR